jgi:hypothetical protein
MKKDYFVNTALTNNPILTSALAVIRHQLLNFPPDARFALRQFIARKVIPAASATYGLSLPGKSTPYARSPPSPTKKNVTIVPGKPKMKANVRQSRPLLVDGLMKQRRAYAKLR